LSRADKTVTSCTFEIDLNPETQLPRSIKMTVLTGVRGATGEKPKRDKSFNEGVEHVAFHFNYGIETADQIAFKIPREAMKLIK